MSITKIVFGRFWVLLLHRKRITLRILDFITEPQHTLFLWGEGELPREATLLGVNCRAAIVGEFNLDVGIFWQRILVGNFEGNGGGFVVFDSYLKSLLNFHRGAYELLGCKLLDGSAAYCNVLVSAN